MYHWKKIPMKFPGTCIVCDEKIPIDEMGLWAKGLGVKHIGCGNEIILHVGHDAVQDHYLERRI